MCTDYSEAKYELGTSEEEARFEHFVAAFPYYFMETKDNVMLRAIYNGIFNRHPDSKGYIPADRNELKKYLEEDLKNYD